MIYGYARVSSVGQDLYGNSREGQEKDLRNAGCQEIYYDDYTGTKMDRPQLTKLLSILQEGDRFVVTKIDRFARTTKGGIETIEELMNRGVSVHVLNVGLIDDTSTGRMIVRMLLSFAEFERDMIAERTMMGKAIAKANNPNWKVGRKEIHVDKKTLKELHRQQKARKITVKECCERLGISETTWRNKLKTV